jgi:hypothetical protein
MDTNQECSDSPNGPQMFCFYMYRPQGHERRLQGLTRWASNAVFNTYRPHKDTNQECKDTRDGPQVFRFYTNQPNRGTNQDCRDPPDGPQMLRLYIYRPPSDMKQDQDFKDPPDGFQLRFTCIGPQGHEPKRTGHNIFVNHKDVGRSQAHANEHKRTQTNADSLCGKNHKNYKNARTQQLTNRKSPQNPPTSQNK